LILLKPFNGSLDKPLPQRRPGVGYARPTKPCRWRRKRLHHGGDVCVLVLFINMLLTSSYHIGRRWQQGMPFWPPLLGGRAWIRLT
jgi:hypothetical protein